MRNNKENREKCKEFMTVVAEALESMDMPLSNYFSSPLKGEIFLITSFIDGLTVDEVIDQILSM